MARGWLGGRDFYLGVLECWKSKKGGVSSTYTPFWIYPLLHQCLQNCTFCIKGVWNSEMHQFFFVVNEVSSCFDHSSDIRNTHIFRRCSKRSIFKYLKIWKYEYVKYDEQKAEQAELKLCPNPKTTMIKYFQVFFKKPKKKRIESMSLLWFWPPLLFSLSASSAATYIFTAPTCTTTIRITGEPLCVKWWVSAFHTQI